VRILLAALVLGFLVGSAHAQSAGFPKYVVGDEWKLSNGEAWKVVKAEAEMVVLQRSGFAGCPDCLYHYNNTGDLLKTERSDGAPPAWISGMLPVGKGWKSYAYPIELKKEWRFTGTGLTQRGTVNFTADCRVEAYEDVTTKAGTFKAFRVSRQWRAIGSDIQNPSGFTWSDTVWFAPDTKTTVKYKSLNPRAPADWELTAYTVK
jgi:hypothetical protein